MRFRTVQKRLCKIIIAFVVLLIVTAPAKAATEQEIETAIEKGLAWLADQNNPDGSWGSWPCDMVGITGLVVLKFEERARELGFADPMDPNYQYHKEVKAGLDYIVANSYNVDISGEPSADGDGDGTGTCFSSCWERYYETYETAVAMMALAASQRPDLYGDLLQDAVDWMSFAQNNANCDIQSGGWSYYANSCYTSDNAASGYAALGLGYAAAPAPVGFELTISQFVLDELNLWIDIIQDPVNGDADDGGSWLEPISWPPLVDILKTGNLLYEMALVADTSETQRVKDAINYIERHWSDVDWCGSGWLDHRQAMFTMTMGFEALGIEKIDLDGDDFAEHDWLDEVSTHLVSTQNADGSWPIDCWDSGHIPILSTAWALLTLEKAEPKSVEPGRVSVDIKPQSCPNPLNVGSSGVFPVAVLGTGDFDVSAIDIASIRLADVAPIRSSLKDAATPADGNECECSTAGRDGYVDLTLKFETPAVVQELLRTRGELVEGEKLTLTLKAYLTDETLIEGADCVRIVGKVSKPVAAKIADIYEDGIVNLLDLGTVAKYWLESSYIGD